MALETLAWPADPSSTDLNDGAQSYNMGIKFGLVTDETDCYGVQWRVPDSLAPPAGGGVYAVSLWTVIGETRLAYKEFTPVAGGYQDVLFDAPVPLALATEYVVAVYTNHYVFRAPSPTGGWHVYSPSGNTDAYESKLATDNSGAATAVFPASNFNGWYYVAPINEVAGAVTPTPAGVAVPLTLGVPAVDPSALPRPGGIAVPITLGTPATDAITTAPAPTGLGIPITLGSPAVGVGVHPGPGSVTLPIALGVPQIGASPNPTGIGIALALGAPAVGFAAVPVPDGLPVPLVLGTPGVDPAGLPGPAGIAIGIGLGTPSVISPVGPDGLPIPITLGTPASGATNPVTTVPPMIGTAAVTGGPSGTATVSALTGTATIT